MSKCPHCNGTGISRGDDAQKPLTSQQVASGAFVFSLVALFGTLGLGGNFFLGMALALVAYIATVWMIRAGEKRMGIK